MKYFLTLRYLFFWCLLLSNTACKKFVTVTLPANQVSGDIIFTDDANANATITGIYARMMKSGGYASGGIYSIDFLNGLSADELLDYSLSTNQFFANALKPSDGYISSFLWNEPYQYIYTANAVLQGLDKATGLTPAVRQQLKGEASFIRAFCYLYLVAEFDDVPLHLSTDYRINNMAARTPVKDVYTQIVADLTLAQSLLPADYAFAANQRIRPNKWAATALLARVLLYTGDWANAEQQSTAIIQNTSVYSLVPSLNNVFLKNSAEAIWQLMPVVPGSNTNQGKYFILTGVPSIVSLSNNLLASFEPGDNRKTSWVASISVGSNTYYYPFKYKLSSGTTLTEYSMVLRLAEQYLIRAEARAQLDKLTGATGAISDLNIIRNRAGLPDFSGSVDKASVLKVILHERQVELFTEWGHRWLDLRRMGFLNAVMDTVTLQKGGIWKPSAAFYPIPQQEISNNPQVVQNAGY